MAPCAPGRAVCLTGCVPAAFLVMHADFKLNPISFVPLSSVDGWVFIKVACKVEAEHGVQIPKKLFFQVKNKRSQKWH